MKKILKKLVSFILSFSLILCMGQISNIKETQADTSFYYVNGKYFGDANGNGRIDSADLTMLRGFINGNIPSDEMKYKMDLNGDGRLSNDDLELMRNCLYEGNIYFPVERVYYGDCTYDNRITLADFSSFVAAIGGYTNISANDIERMDLNGDGVFNQEDVNFMSDYITEKINYFPVQNMLYKIEITTFPSKQNYKKGESIDTSGMVVEATKNNGAYKEVYNYSVSGDTNTVGENEVLVSYSEGDVTKTASFTITVDDDYTPTSPTSTPPLVSDDWWSPSPTPTQTPYWTSNDYTWSISSPTPTSHGISGGGSSTSTKRPVLDQESTSTKRPVLDQESTSDKRPVLDQESTSSKRPILTYTSSPSSTEEPDMEIFTPEPYPEETYFPDWYPSITTVPVSTSTYVPELKITVEPVELEANTEGHFPDNEIQVSVTGTYSFKVDTNSSSWLRVCKKNISASASTTIWLNKDDISFYVFADENTSASSRTGDITVTAQNYDKTVTKKIKVKQEASEAKLTVSVSQITANSKGTTSVSSVDVKTNKTGGFSVDNGGASWIKVGSSSAKNRASSNVSFESDGTVYIFVSENISESSRTATITVTHQNGETKEKIKINQEGTKLVLDVDSTNKTADNDGSFYNNAIHIKTSNTGSFTATVEDADWLKLSSKNTESFSEGITTLTLSGDSSIYLVADENSGSVRTATVVITHESEKLSKKVTVTQMGRDSVYLQVDRETAYFDDPEQGISEIITVSADENTKWTATASEDWIKIVNDNWLYSEQYASIENTGKGGFYILVKENDTYKERAGKIVISAPGLESYEIYVQQAENEISINSLLPETLVKVSKKSFKKGKTSKIKLVYPEGLYPSDIKKVTFSSNKKKVATVDSKGIIKGHKKGKAVISVKITLENGSSKTFKAKITVDKRKVKLSKFK